MTISERMLEEVENLAAESELNHETALARALELLLLRELHRACRARRPYTPLDRMPMPRDMDLACRQRVRAALKQKRENNPPADLVIAAREAEC